jgi:1-acyl-sn-glycerol-3-phosphate acyltransferase
MFRAMVNPWQRLLWDVRRRGFEHLPLRGPAILAPNHLSFIDSMLLMLSVDREIAFVGKAEYMREWPSRWLFPALGMIPIDRSGGEAAEEALDQASRVLERGQLFGIFPEGTRSRDGYLHRGRTGAARLALRTGAPLFPVGIRGTDHIQPIGMRIPRPFVGCSITVGPAIDVKRHLTHTQPHMRLRAITDELMYEISLLSRQTYVDRYGGSSAGSIGRQMNEVPVAPHDSSTDVEFAGNECIDSNAACPPLSFNGRATDNADRATGPSVKGRATCGVKKIDPASGAAASEGLQTAAALQAEALQRH